MFLPHPRVKVIIVGSLRDREVACSASDRQGSNFESCVWRTVSSQSSHHPQEVLPAQFSLYVHKGGLKPDSFHFFIKLSLLWITMISALGHVCSHSEHDTLIRCWFNIGPWSATLAQHRAYFGSLYHVKLGRPNNVDFMLAHLLRRWPNIKSTLGLNLVFSESYNTTQLG